MGRAGNSSRAREAIRVCQLKVRTGGGLKGTRAKGAEATKATSKGEEGTRVASIREVKSSGLSTAMRRGRLRGQATTRGRGKHPGVSSKHRLASSSFRGLNTKEVASDHQ
jgi:hypothetical protein